MTARPVLRVIANVSIHEVRRADQALQTHSRLVLKMMEHLEPSEQKAWLQIYEKVHTFCQAK